MPNISPQCSGDICFGLNIPENTALSGNGDIYVHISAPTTYSWVGLGQGSSMSGSQIFVMYTSANGDNVTISPRLGMGYNMPQFITGSHITLLEGSGIFNGQMTVNARCSSCQSWSGGSMEFTASSATWIYASRSGAPLNSDNQSEIIAQHGQSYGSFNWDFRTAKGGSSMNPFTTPSSIATGASSTQTCVPFSEIALIPSVYAGSERLTGNEVNYCDTSNSSSSSGGNATEIGGATSWEYERKMLIAHGVLACVASVIFFPIGAISIRLFSFPHLVWFHAAMQVFAYTIYIAALVIGVYFVTPEDLLKDYHLIIGILVSVHLFFQPILGLVHHVFFKKFGRRTFWSYAHLWLGRIIITLGIINGGLGLLLTDNAGDSVYIAYGTIASLIWLAYAAAALYGKLKRKTTTSPLAGKGRCRALSSRNTIVATVCLQEAGAKVKLYQASARRGMPDNKQADWLAKDATGHPTGASVGIIGPTSRH
ncbi:hypothetical protein B0J12DRAFT_711210 [Macrophomina phaseolina]|uniref:Cytochrome b561 domain-containing protein n=1 Tax=Macrophomina phaseolina TaxID=35725 RepID=A0ABQ8G8F4_9PEZI|nr:hypothetical protein B0J12DRAFT_711210 [Macrophomina phaseolina]